MSKRMDEEEFDEEKMREAVKRYVRAEMDLLDKKNIIREPLPDSRRYRRRLNRVFRKYGFRVPGTERKPGYRYRVAFATVAACFSLLFAVTVGAKVLGIHPWEYMSSHVSGIEMEHRSYQKPSDDTDSNSVKKRISDEPLYVPSGLKETERTKGDTVLMVAWLADKESGIQYSRYEITEGMSFSVDDECDIEKQIAVAGYVGTYREKSKEKRYWIVWDDADYVHHLNATDIPNAKEELLRMAASMYEE